MNLTPLYELKERLEASVIAGASLLSEDFRLKRAVEQIAPLAKVSPVFDKIFQSSQQLLSQKQNGPSLLEILALLNAVLTTQAAIGVNGECTPLSIASQTSDSHSVSSENATTSQNICSDTKYSDLAPLLEALTTSGSGHYNLLMEAHKTHPKHFLDYRLKPALVAGLNAGYAELANQVEEWLSQGDPSIIPLLKQGFDPQGKKEMLRRVRVIEALAKGQENDWYLTMLVDAKKDIRAALLYALHHTPENCDQLIAFTKTEKGQCKKAALWSLAQMDLSKTRDFWETQLKKNPAATASYLTLSTSDTVSDLISHPLHALLDQLEAQADEGNFQLTEKFYKQFQSLCSALQGKASLSMLDFYRRIACDSRIDQFHTKDNLSLFDQNDIIQDSHLVLSSAYHISSRLNDALLYTTDKRLFDLANELYQTYGEPFLKPALTIALLTKDAASVYDAFAPQIEKELVASKDIRESYACLSMMENFSELSWHSVQKQYTYIWNYYDECREKQVSICRPLYEKLDLRWFRLFTHPNLLKTAAYSIYNTDHESCFIYNWDFTLGYLICPSDQDICKILGDYFYQRALKTASIPQAIFAHELDYYRLLDRCSFKNGQGLVIRDLKKARVQYWNVRYMLHIAPMSREDKIKELDQIHELTKTKEIKISGWNEKNYLELRKLLEEGSKLCTIDYV